MDFHRWSSLVRRYDLGLGYNRLILLLTGAAVASGAAVGWLDGLPLSQVAWRAFAGGVTVFVAAVLAKEIDPDHPRSAVLAAALAIPTLWLARLSGLSFLLWLVLMLRFVNRSTGLAPKVTDTLALLAVTAWVGWAVSPFLAILAGGVLVLDGLLPDGRRAHVLPGVLVALAATAWLLLGAGLSTPTPSSPELTIVLLAVAVAFIGVILASYQITAVGDATGRPLQVARVQAAQAVGLGVALLMASWAGPEGVVLASALWAALLGAVAMRLIHARTHRSVTTG